MGREGGRWWQAWRGEKEKTVCEPRIRNNQKTNLNVPPVKVTVCAKAPACVGNRLMTRDSPSRQNGNRRGQRRAVGGINKSLPAAEESDKVLTFYWHIGQTNGKCRGRVGRGLGGVEVNEKSQKDRGKCTYIYNSIFTIRLTGVLDHHAVSDSGPALQTLQHSVILGSL